MQIDIYFFAFECYKQTFLLRKGKHVFFVLFSRVPGLAFRNQRPYLELQRLELLRLASTEIQTQFFQVIDSPDGRQFSSKLYLSNFFMAATKISFLFLSYRRQGLRFVFSQRT